MQVYQGLLRYKVLPPRGGDTMFADMEAVYADLSPPLQRMLEELSVVHDQVAGFIPLAEKSISASTTVL